LHGQIFCIENLFARGLIRKLFVLKSILYATHISREMLISKKHFFSVPLPYCSLILVLYRKHVAMYNF
jgi:hypothetical protein